MQPPVQRLRGYPLEGARTGSLGLNSLFEGEVFPSCPLDANARAPD